jgi:hypothetical protein
MKPVRNLTFIKRTSSARCQAPVSPFRALPFLADFGLFKERAKTAENRVR